jgi:hypothetical protein
MGGFQVTLLLARRRHMVCWCVSTHTLLPVRGTNQWHTGCTGGVDKWNERGRRSGGHSSIEEYAAKGSSAFSSTHTQNYVFSHDAVPRTGGPLQHDGVAGTKMSAAGAAALLSRHMHTAWRFVRTRRQRASWPGTPPTSSYAATSHAVQHTSPPAREQAIMSCTHGSWKRRTLPSGRLRGALR